MIVTKKNVPAYVGEMDEGKVRIAEIHTPSEDWADPRTGEHKPLNGYRLGVKFIDGRAVLPEPLIEDYHMEELWKVEHSYWKSLIDRFQRDYHYEVVYRRVAVTDED